MLDVWPIGLKTEESEEPATEFGFFATRFVPADKAKRRVRDWVAKSEGMTSVPGVELVLETEEAEAGYPLWALLRRTGGCTLYPLDEQDDSPDEE